MDWDNVYNFIINDAEFLSDLLQFQKDALLPPTNVPVESAWVRSIPSVTASKTAKTVRMSCAVVSILREWHFYFNLTAYNKDWLLATVRILQMSFCACRLWHKAQEEGKDCGWNRCPDRLMAVAGQPSNGALRSCLWGIFGGQPLARLGSSLLSGLRCNQVRFNSGIYTAVKGLLSVRINIIFFDSARMY